MYSFLYKDIIHELTHKLGDVKYILNTFNYFKSKL